MQSPGAGPPRSALFTAWGSAWLAGDASLAELAVRVTAADDRHTVSGLTVDSLPLEQAAGRLRGRGVTTLRLALPVPGDVLGLPGPGGFTTAALAASEGVLALAPDGSGFGLAPTVTAHGTAFDGIVTTVVWTAYPVSVPGPDPGPFLHDAEHDLRRGLLECVQHLRSLDVARWRPEVAGAVQELRSDARRGITDDQLPGGYSTRSRELLTSARQVAGVLALAAQDAGGSVDARETAAREAALLRLSYLVRRAHVAAYNSYALPS